jgi:hypothetical protein
MIMMPYRSPRSSSQLTGLGRLLAPNRVMGNEPCPILGAEWERQHAVRRGHKR